MAGNQPCILSARVIVAPCGIIRSKARQSTRYPYAAAMARTVEKQIPGASRAPYPTISFPEKN